MEDARGYVLIEASHREIFTTAKSSPKRMRQAVRTVRGATACGMRPTGSPLPSSVTWEGADGSAGRCNSEPIGSGHKTMPSIAIFRYKGKDLWLGSPDRKQIRCMTLFPIIPQQAGHTVTEACALCDSRSRSA